ncbi:MAG: hypothetical protein JWO38_33 [Gemmataceae bacterium]|nr:hypothetical protein [Gemmataceae bacterium]
MDYSHTASTPPGSCRSREYDPVLLARYVAWLFSPLSICLELLLVGLLIGGAGDGRVQAMTDLAVALGVPPADVVVGAGAAEGEVIRRTVGTARFVLVTSASHMPRAVWPCHDRGHQLVPAPTSHQVAAAEYPTLQALPSAGNLARAETALHETLGGIWQVVRR